MQMSCNFPVVLSFDTTNSLGLLAKIGTFMVIIKQIL